MAVLQMKNRDRYIQTLVYRNIKRQITHHMRLALDTLHQILSMLVAVHTHRIKRAWKKLDLHLRRGAKRHSSQQNNNEALVHEKNFFYPVVLQYTGLHLVYLNLVMLQLL